MAALLVGAGVAVSPKASNGATPLHYALQDGHADVSRLLLDHGADTRGATNKGVTLLELAQSSNMPEDILERLR
jgi:ankyrin repeat protein